MSRGAEFTTVGKASLGLLEELNNGLHGCPRSRPRCSFTFMEHLRWLFVTLLAQCRIDHATHCAMLQLVLAEDRKEDTCDSY